MFIWNIFYFIACCPFSGHWEKPCLSLFLPVKSDQMPPGLSLWPGPQSLPPQPPLLSIPSVDPFQHTQVCTGSSRWGPTSAEQRGRGKAHLPRPAPPEPAQHPVGILGKNRAQEGASSPCFCVTSLKLGAVTCLHQRESKNPHQCFNYLLKMRQLPLK